MNKFVKKSMAGLLAGVMAVTSLAVGSITAMAAAPEGTPIALGQTVEFTKADSEAKVQTYSFKPATTGYYAFAFSSDAVTDPGYDNERVDFARLKVTSYEAQSDYSYDFLSLGSIMDYYTATTKKVTDKTTGTTKTEYTTGYLSGYATARLDSECTYYFTADLNSVPGNAYTKAKLTILATDYSVENHEFFTPEEPQKTEDTSTKTETTTTTPFFCVEYVGNGTDVTIPDTLNDVWVGHVTGVKSENKRIKSLTLGKNVKKVEGFNSQYKLASLTLNDGLETIGEYAFFNDFALTGQLVIPTSVKTIGYKAFYGTGYGSAKVMNPETKVEYEALGFKDVLNADTADPNDTKAALIDGFYIITPNESDAARYAKISGIPSYDPANCTHMWNLVSSTKATYFKKGSATYTCAICGATKTEATDKKLVALKSIKSAKKGQLTIKSKALDSKVTGYQIQVSTSKKFKKKATKTIKVKTNSKKALNKTVTGLKSGKKYYVRVRVYKGKKTGAYTATKAVKVK